MVIFQCHFERKKRSFMGSFLDTVPFGLNSCCLPCMQYLVIIEKMTVNLNQFNKMFSLLFVALIANTLWSRTHYVSCLSHSYLVLIIIPTYIRHWNLRSRFTSFLCQCIENMYKQIEKNGLRYQQRKTLFTKHNSHFELTPKPAFLVLLHVLII